MTELESLKDDYFRLIEQENPPLIDLRNILLEVEDFINSSNYQDSSAEERNLLQEFRQNLKSRLSDHEEQREAIPESLNHESSFLPEDQVTSENSSSFA